MTITVGGILTAERVLVGEDSGGWWAVCSCGDQVDRVNESMACTWAHDHVAEHQS